MSIIFPIIATIVMFGSGYTVFKIVNKKIPLLLDVKYNVEEEKQLDQLIKENIKKLNPWQYLKFVSFLEGMLVKLRTWIIKAGGKTNDLIKRVNEKHEEHKPEINNIFTAGYWQEMKEKKTSQRRRLLRDEDLNKIIKK
jgi:hypothetical protein